MTDVQTGGGVSVPLENLVVSPMPGQVERRKNFDKAALDELTETVRSVGIVQALLVRPIGAPGSGRLEIVAGERRSIAARRVGLTEVPVTIRDLTDEQVQEIQLIENLQREGLREIAEAEGYERLMKEHGYGIENIVAKVGKSRAYVYSRIKLLALCPIARQALSKNVINASVALLIARIPDEGLQKKALEEVTKRGYRGQPMSFRDAQEEIQNQFMLRLADAPFPTNDAQLVPTAGTCGDCPKRTGNQPELFKDVKGTDVCTDPVCFKAKRMAFVERQLAKAKETGQTVIQGAQAKKLLPSDYHDSIDKSSGYVSLDSHCYDDSKQRTYRQILGKQAPAPTLVVHPKKGDIHEAVRLAEIQPLLKKAGATARSRSTDSGAKADREKREKAKREGKFRVLLLQATLVRLPTKFNLEALAELAAQSIDALGGEEAKAFYLANGWPLPKNSWDFSDAPKRFRELTADRLAQAIAALPLLPDVAVSAYRLGKPQRLLAAAKSVRIDVAKFRREFEADTKKAAAKPAPPKRKAS